MFKNYFNPVNLVNNAGLTICHPKMDPPCGKISSPLIGIDFMPATFRPPVWKILRSYRVCGYPNQTVPMVVQVIETAAKRPLN